MQIDKAYNLWSEQYDSNKNKTRDQEAVAFRQITQNLAITNCLEIGCGTGKNTVWLETRAQYVTAVDFSAQMLAKAKEKVTSPQVEFIQADITHPWHYKAAPFDLITFSLVLEHIETLDAIFAKACQVLAPGGHIYVGELHPFKQYTGTKARFDTPGGRIELTCFTHHISDFMHAAYLQGLTLVDLKEYFDEDDRAATPRIVALLFKK